MLAVCAGTRESICSPHRPVCHHTCCVASPLPCRRSDRRLVSKLCITRSCASNHCQVHPASWRNCTQDHAWQTYCCSFCSCSCFLLDTPVNFCCPVAPPAPRSKLNPTLLTGGAAAAGWLLSCSGCCTCCCSVELELGTLALAPSCCARRCADEPWCCSCLACCRGPACTSELVGAVGGNACGKLSAQRGRLEADAD